MHHGFHKNINVFNIDNNQKRIMMISEDHVTLKGGVMMLEILRHQLHFNRYSYRKLLIYIIIIFDCISAGRNPALMSRRDSFRIIPGVFEVMCLCSERPV